MYFWNFFPRTSSPLSFAQARVERLVYAIICTIHYPSRYATTIPSYTSSELELDSRVYSRYSGIVFFFFFFFLCSVGDTIPVTYVISEPRVLDENKRNLTETSCFLYSTCSMFVEEMSC